MGVREEKALLPPSSAPSITGGRHDHSHRTCPPAGDTNMSFPSKSRANRAACASPTASMRRNCSVSIRYPIFFLPRFFLCFPNDAPHAHAQISNFDPSSSMGGILSFVMSRFRPEMRVVVRWEHLVGSSNTTRLTCNLEGCWLMMLLSLLFYRLWAWTLQARPPSFTK